MDIKSKKIKTELVTSEEKNLFNQLIKNTLEVKGFRSDLYYSFELNLIKAGAALNHIGLQTVQSALHASLREHDLIKGRSKEVSDIVINGFKQSLSGEFTSKDVELGLKGKKAEEVHKKIIDAVVKASYNSEKLKGDGEMRDYLLENNFIYTKSPAILGLDYIESMIKKVEAVFKENAFTEKFKEDAFKIYQEHGGPMDKTKNMLLIQ
jgi:hypothetical protein